MTAPTLCFIDTETTGLDPERHEVWEVACIIRKHGEADAEYVWQLPVDLGRADPMALRIGRFHERRHARLKPSTVDRDPSVVVQLVDPEGVDGELSIRPLDVWCEQFARLTWNAHMIGAVPSFDTDRLERLLRRHGACPGWHYQPVDVEAVVAGYLIGLARGIARCALSDPQANRVREATGIDVEGIGQYRGALEGVDVGKTLPWSSDELAARIGIRPDEEGRHTALGDARWARDQWDRITSYPMPSADMINDAEGASGTEKVLGALDDLLTAYVALEGDGCDLNRHEFDAAFDAARSVLAAERGWL